jgi:hypothetical protein
VAIRADFAAPSLIGLGDEAFAAQAFETLGISPMRLEILRLAMSRPELSTADVMYEFDITRSCARQHLLGLTDGQLLLARRTTHPRGSGPITYWHADHGEIAQLLDQLTNYFLSGASRTAAERQRINGTSEYYPGGEAWPDEYADLG